MLRKYLYFYEHAGDIQEQVFSRSIMRGNSRATIVLGGHLGRQRRYVQWQLKLIKVIFALLRDERMFTAKAPELALAA